MLLSTLRNLAHVVIPARYRPVGYLTHLAQRKTHLRVRHGPFAGMEYVLDSQGSCYIPKLLGIYERELHEVVRQIVQAVSRCGMIDIGAAEGYYAVGVALKAPTARVVAFEESESGRVLLRAMVEKNRVADRVEILGRCEIEDLRRALRAMPGAFLICDVEGYEEQLLDPAASPELQGASILVEMHDFLRPGLTDLIRKRFSPTHRIQHIAQTPRDAWDFPFRSIGTALLPARYIQWAVDEWRPVPMHWLFLQANGRVGQ